MEDAMSTRSENSISLYRWNIHTVKNGDLSLLLKSLYAKIPFFILIY